jgi:3-methyladenine DNA glycosylase AlkC
LKNWAKVKDENTKWIIKDGMKKLVKEEQEKLKSLIG